MFNVTIFCLTTSCKRTIFWPPKEARKCSAAQGPHSEAVPRAFWRLVSKSCDECKGSFARGCVAKRWSHWTCSSLGTIFQLMRINSVSMSNVFVIIKMCYVHNQWYDISCATLYVWFNTAATVAATTTTTTTTITITTTTTTTTTNTTNNNSKDNWNHLTIIQTIPEQYAGKARKQVTTKTVILGAANLLRKVLVFYIFNMRNNITRSTNCKYRTAILHTILKKYVFFRVNKCKYSAWSEYKYNNKENSKNKFGATCAMYDFS